MQAIQICFLGYFHQRHCLKIAEPVTIGKGDNHFLFEQVNRLEALIVFFGAGAKYTIQTAAEQQLGDHRGGHVMQYDFNVGMAGTKSPQKPAETMRTDRAHHADVQTFDSCLNGGVGGTARFAQIVINTLKMNSHGAAEIS